MTWITDQPGSQTRQSICLLAISAVYHKPTELGLEQGRLNQNNFSIPSFKLLCQQHSTAWVGMELLKQVVRTEVLVVVERMAGQWQAWRADTHNGAGASQHIVNRSLATMARNPLQQCPSMPTTTRGIACRGARGNRGERERCLPPPREVTGPSLDLLPPLAAANTHLQRLQHFHVEYL